MKDINISTIDDLIVSVSGRIREGVESGKLPLSSEATFRFLFAWELGCELAYPANYRVDVEFNAYSDLDSEDTFLDLLVYTDPSVKIGLEFKLPKSSGLHGSNSTQIRARILRDISRLSYLVRQSGESKIQLGYFVCATNEGVYLTPGRKVSNVQYKTYHGEVYRPGEIIPKGKPPNGIERELVLPVHEVRFEWQGIEEKGGRRVPSGRFAWLKPIKVWA